MYVVEYLEVALQLHQVVLEVGVVADVVDGVGGVVALLYEVGCMAKGRSMARERSGCLSSLEGCEALSDKLQAKPGRTDTCNRSCLLDKAPRGT